GLVQQVTDPVQVKRRVGARVAREIERRHHVDEPERLEVGALEQPRRPEQVVGQGVVAVAGAAVAPVVPYQAGVTGFPRDLVDDACLHQALPQPVVELPEPGKVERLTVVLAAALGTAVVRLVVRIEAQASRAGLARLEEGAPLRDRHGGPSGVELVCSSLERIEGSPVPGVEVQPLLEAGELVWRKYQAGGFADRVPPSQPCGMGSGAMSSCCSVSPSKNCSLSARHTVSTRSPALSG